MKLSPKVTQSLDRVVEKFKTGDLSPISKAVRIQLDPNAPARKWSLSNRVIAFIQSEEFDCRGYRQWQEVGRQVKKGGKAVYIIRPHMIKLAEEFKDTSGEKYTCIGFSSVAVFPASTTDGESPIPSYAPRELPPLMDIAKRLNIKVEYVPIAPDRLGDCQINGEKIRLGSHDPRIFFHELAHAIHAKIDGELKGGQNLEQETIAEFTATVLMDLYGLPDNTGNTWKYISLYAKDPLTAITKAMSTVEKVLSILFEEQIQKGETI